MTFIKRISRKHFLILSFVSLFCFSCSDMLDLQPKNSISEATFWETEKDLISGVNAVYNTLQGDENPTVRTFEQFGMLDAITDIAAARTVGPWNAPSSGVLESNNYLVSRRWVECYTGIVRANDVIVNIDNIDADETLKEESLGEVYFLRAWFYFNLVFFFGDVPIVLDVPELANALVDKSPQSKVIDQMHIDLDHAIALLPVKNRQDGRVAKGAALALKAKIHMQQQEFEAAITYLQQIMNLGYSLHGDYRKLFLPEAENNNEVIFDIQFTAQTGMNQGNKIQTLYGNKSLKAPGWSWLLPTKELIQLYETTPDGLTDPNPLFNKKDPRMDMTVIRPGATFIDKDDIKRNYYEQVQNYEHAQTGMHCRKFLIEGSSPDFPHEGYWDGPQNVILIRYADILLLYAEAMNEVYGPSQDVYDALNQVRQRLTVNMPPIENKSQTELRDIIRRERGVELALEGWRFFDLKRWGIIQEVNDGFQIVHVLTNNPFMTRIFEDRNHLWPLPLTEIDVNPNLLPQNDGY